MFDFDVVTGPSDLAKRERSDVRRSPAPRMPASPPTTAPPLVSGIVAEDGAGYPETRPA